MTCVRQPTPRNAYVYGDEFGTSTYQQLGDITTPAKTAARTEERAPTPSSSVRASGLVFAGDVHQVCPFASGDSVHPRTSLDVGRSSSSTSMTNTSDEPTTSMTVQDGEPAANRTPSVDSGCPRCPRWKIDQRGRQYGEESPSPAYISGVSTLSTLIHYLSRTWARVLRARLTHNSCRFTPDSVDTHTQNTENSRLAASPRVDGVHGAENRSVDTVDTPRGWSA